MDQNDFKRMAGEEAAKDVRSGMIVGLGHGSTAIWALRAISRGLKDGSLTDVLGVACSRQVEGEAHELDIPLTNLDEHPVVDLTIDGADEVDERLNLIKGGGGALTREKIVAQASKRELIIVDEGKLSRRLGEKFYLPVEVVPFAAVPEQRFLESLGAKVELRRRSGEVFVTDQGNWILDARFGPIEEPGKLAGLLNGRAGVLEHGLFVGLASQVIVAGPQGVRRLDPK